MTRTERICGALISAVLTAGCALCVYLLSALGVGQTRVTLLACVVTFFAFIGFLGVFMNYETAFKGGFIGSTIALIIFAGYVIAAKNGWLSLFGDRAAMQEFISRYDGYAIAVFIAVQFLQVTVLPLPSTITTLAGIALFGVWKTVLYSSIGIIAGSMFAFFLGRSFGVRLIVWICGSKMFSKYRRYSEGKDVLLLYAMFLLPFFPDDLLCLIAGLGTMSYRSFFVMMLVTRPLGALWVAGVFKSAVSIPFSGWGIAVWAALFVVTATVFFLLYRYGDTITRALAAFTAKLTGKRKDVKSEDGHAAKRLKTRRTTLAALLKKSPVTLEEKIDKRRDLTDYRNL